MKLQLYLQKQTAYTKEIPQRKNFFLWVKTALKAVMFNHANVIELAIRLVDEEESAALNKQYRHKSGPTNILSFTAENLIATDPHYLGDLVVCVPLVIKEAAEQNKTLTAHWAHLTIHGILHLLGYDHEKSNEAVVMEKLETAILESLNYQNPYG